MHTRQSGGESDTEEKAVAVSACGRPNESIVVTIVTPAANDPIAARKLLAESERATASSSGDCMCLTILAFAAMQLLQKSMVRGELGLELGRFELYVAKD